MSTINIFYSPSRVKKNKTSLRCVRTIRYGRGRHCANLHGCISQYKEKEREMEADIACGIRSRALFCEVCGCARNSDRLSKAVFQ